MNIFLLSLIIKPEFLYFYNISIIIYDKELVNFTEILHRCLDIFNLYSFHFVIKVQQFLIVYTKHYWQKEITLI